MAIATKACTDDKDLPVFGVSLACIRESHMSRRFRRYLKFAAAVG
jgi:hypothetical protein